MADSTHWVKHIESYVDSASSPAQQAITVDAIATLLKKDMLSLEALVREMEMYLTTTDSIIRTRGILLLAEVLTHLASKPLDDATIQSLIGFFTERLADWKALRGALVGCLALMERKSNMGMISGSEARAVAESFLQNIQVQSLAQYDRKICFELLNCLLDRFPDAAVALGDLLTYAICEAIDGEKDPQCLMLAFHVVEVLAQIFASPSGSLASYAEELFNIFGCYFPIHFTHSKGEDVEIKTEELSRALMLAFASTPLFEPFAIPLLLEKLSSSLPSAKLESLKYLNYCTLKYGKDRMVKHAKALWSSLKDAIYNLPNSSFSLESETLHCKGFEENEIMTEALLLLQKVIQQNDESLLNLILGDEDIVGTMKYVACYNGHDEISTQIRQRLHAAGSILSALVKASSASCNRVFESFFPTLMDAMGLSTQISQGASHINYDSSARLNYGALYLIVELLSACRCLVVGPDGCNVISVSKLETWCCLLHNSCSSLTEAFNFTLLRSMHDSAHDAHIQCGVKGMQILATFPGSFFPVSKSIFENILTKLMSIITLQFNKVELWKLVLRSLVEIGSFIDKLQESEKAASFGHIVVDRIISLMSCDAPTMPLYLKVEAISDIGMTGLNFMLKIVQGVEKVISANFTEAYIHGNVSSGELTVQLLEFYASKVLPRLESVGGSEEVPLHFVVSICDQIGETYTFKTGFQEEKLLDATMLAVKHAVGYCSVESQSIIIQKAFTILSSSSLFPLDESMSGAKLVKLERLQVPCSLDCFSCRDDWIISLFAAVIIALRPQTHIPNLKVVLQLFMTTALFGHIPSAQALGSLVNKLPLKSNASNYCSLEEAMDIIFNSSLWCHCGDGLPNNCPHKGDGNEVDHSSSSFRFASSKLYQVDNIVGLAWIGKGLLLRGHETLKDITMTILSCLMPSIGSSALPLEQGTMCQMKAAADALHIIMADSEACLNRRFHATMKPLYKQRFFNIVIPFLLSTAGKSDSSNGRLVMYRAVAHVVSNTPLSAVVSEAKKLIPVLIDGLSNFREDILNRDIIYNILLVLSGILTDKNGLEAAVEHAHIVINSLAGLASYPHMVLVRETAIQCLVAMSVLPHARIYPMRIQVLRALSNALDDPKRVVRQEAVRCRQAWASIASRSLHF